MKIRMNPPQLSPADDFPFSDPKNIVAGKKPRQKSILTNRYTEMISKIWKVAIFCVALLILARLEYKNRY